MTGEKCVFPHTVLAGDDFLMDKMITWGETVATILNVLHGQDE